MQNYTFISYSRIDESNVQKIYEILVSLGIECWLDVEEIKPGEDWDKKLQNGIEGCSAFVIVCTPTSMQSKNVQAEWQYAFELKKKIHPVVLHPCTLPFRLKIFQHIDLSTLGFDAGLKQLAETLPLEENIEAPTKVSTSTSHKSNEIHALVRRTYENWESFGLFPAKSVYDLINKSREDLEDIEPSILEFIFLCARKLEDPGSESWLYWATRIRKENISSDRIENLILDSIKKSRLYYTQIELEQFNSTRMARKIGELIELSTDVAETHLLLEASIRILTGLSPDNSGYTKLENVLIEKFEQIGDNPISRSLGWLRSKKMLQIVKNKIAINKPQSMLDLDRAHLTFLANFSGDDAHRILGSFTPSGFAFIPCGWFSMGSDSGYDYMGAPLHDVFVPTFWLRKIPVTKSEYDKHELLPLADVYADLPMHNISWIEAHRWITQLSHKTRMPLSLPTEAMWEKAASWDASNKRKQRYPWGEEPQKDFCNTIESGLGQLTSVGKYSPEGDSPYGVADMIGNVWEWTSSPFKVYPYVNHWEHKDTSEQWDLTGKQRVMRGPALDSRRGLKHDCTTRIAFNTSYAFQYSGMRVALVLDT